MNELAQWAGYQFYISADSAVLFEKLKLSAEMETEEQEDQGQKYVSFKSGKPVEISFGVILNAGLGVDVRKRCLEFLNAAQTGESGYFYMGGKRLLPFEMMLTKASTDEVQTAPGGKWVAVNVTVTFRQSENGTILGGVIGKKKEDVTGGGGGDGSGRKNWLVDNIDKINNANAVGLAAVWAESKQPTTETSESEDKDKKLEINMEAAAVQNVMSVASAAKTVSSGVTQSKAAEAAGNASPSGGKKVKVSSSVLSKITKK